MGQYYHPVIETEDSVLSKPCVCEHCGKEFIPNSASQKFCSRECYIHRKKKQEALGTTVRVTRSIRLTVKHSIF